MNTGKSPNALLVAGPTASGKSSLAMRLAKQRDGVIINADALQVYRDLRILSARPSVEDEAVVPHRLYGHVRAGESYSVARWLEHARAEIAAAWEAGMLPIVTGGTGLYFKALLHGLAEVPPIAAEVRARWRDYGGDVHAELGRRDPPAASRLAPGDRQRIIRALEVIDGTGRPLSHWQAAAQAAAVLAGALVERLLVDAPRQELYARAESRFDAMMAAGALDEVRPLLGLDSSLPMMKAIGVPELVSHLRGEIPLDQAVVLAKIATRHYIKRQHTWWRGQMTDWRLVSGSQSP